MEKGEDFEVVMVVVVVVHSKSFNTKEKVNELAYSRGQLE